MFHKETLVVIPTYNEASNLTALINELDKLHPFFDCLMVDDNSPDGTAGMIMDFMATRPWLHLLQRPEKKGLGPAYLMGFEWALRYEYRFIVEMDADLSHNPHDVLRLVEKCQAGSDLAVGSRYLDGIRIINWPFYRLLISYCGSIYTKIWTGLPLTDPTSGFKCFRRKVLETIDQNKVVSNGYVFQIEMDLLAWNLGFKLSEVPIIFTERQLGKSKMSRAIILEAAWRVPFMGFCSRLGRFKCRRHKSL